MTSRDSGRRTRLSCTELEHRDTPALTGFTASGAIAGGAPLIEVDRPDRTQLVRFEAFDPSFTGGVRVATGELDGNLNTAEVVAVAGPGGGPRVQVFAVNTTTGQVTTLADFLVFEPTFRDGLRVAVGNLSGTLGAGLSSPVLGINGLDQVAVGADAGGGPRVTTFNLVNGAPVQIPGPLGNFFAFEPTFRGGVRVAAGDVDRNPANGDELVVAAGVGGGPRVRVFRADGTVIQDFLAFPTTVTTGVDVAVDPVTGQLLTSQIGGDFSQRNAALNATTLNQLSLTQAAAAQAQAVFPGTALPSVFNSVPTIPTLSFPSFPTFGSTVTTGGTTTTMF